MEGSVLSSLWSSLVLGVNLFFIFGRRGESPFAVVRRGGRVSRQPCVTLELPVWMAVLFPLDAFFSKIGNFLTFAKT